MDDNKNIEKTGIAPLYNRKTGIRGPRMFYFVKLG